MNVVEIMTKGFFTQKENINKNGRGANVDDTVLMKKKISITREIYDHGSEVFSYLVWAVF